jgi:hypothetical protein
MSTTNAEDGAPVLEWPMEKVRDTFKNYFVEQHGHVFWPSSPCVPVDDPTLLFTNAGMNQYKPLFLGTYVRTIRYEMMRSLQNMVPDGAGVDGTKSLSRERSNRRVFLP